MLDLRGIRNGVAEDISSRQLAGCSGVALARARSTGTAFRQEATAEAISAMTPASAAAFSPVKA